MEKCLAEIITLLVLALPVACVAWTVTHEEVFREPRDLCARLSRDCRHLLQRKFYYAFTCEYCFSHYVALVCVLVTRFHLLFDDWRGSVIGWLALVWIANQYMSVYNRIRVDIRTERSRARMKERALEMQKPEQPVKPR